MKLQVQLGAIAVLQLAAALALQLIVLVTIGPGRETDAFVAAQSVPLVLFSIMSVSLLSIWQPRLAVLADSPTAWLKTQRAAQTQVLIVFGGISSLAALTCAWWLPLIFPAFTAAQIAMAAKLSWLFLLAGVFGGHASVYIAAQRARGRFVGADLTSLVWSLLGAAAAAALVPSYGVEAAAWISLLRAAATAASLCLASGRVLPSLRLAAGSDMMWPRLRPLLAGSALYKTSPLVDRYWASQSGPGGLTVYNLALLAIAAIATVLERSLVGPFSIRAAMLVEAADYAALRPLYRRLLLQITLVTAAVAAVIVALYPVWAAAFMRFMGIPTALSIDLWLISLLLLGYLHVTASGSVCTAVFYAHGDTKTPVIVGIVGFAVGLVLKSFGFLIAGLPGLAAGSSIMFLINLALFSLALRRKRFFG